MGRAGGQEPRAHHDPAARKVSAAGIVEIMNAELTKFEEEHGQPAIAAGFTAIAR